MKSSASLVSMADIARLAEVNPSAVTNWRQRHSESFPQPQPHGEKESFLTTEVADWFDTRRIARSDLRDDELPGTTYGTRFRRNLGTPSSPTNTPLAELWQELARYRGSADVQLYGDLVLGLLYLCAQVPLRWDELVSATQGPQSLSVMQDILEHAMGAHGIRIPRLEGLADMMTGALGKQEPLVAVIKIIDQLRRNAASGGAPPGRDWAGGIFEYLLGRLAAAEGKRGGEFFTPPRVVQILVDLLDPQPGETIYDPCCGSGSLLVAAGRSVEELSGRPTELPLFGRALSERCWTLARMNTELNDLRGGSRAQA